MGCWADCLCCSPYANPVCPWAQRKLSFSTMSSDLPPKAWSRPSRSPCTLLLSYSCLVRGLITNQNSRNRNGEHLSLYNDWMSRMQALGWNNVCRPIIPIRKYRIWLRTRAEPYGWKVYQDFSFSFLFFFIYLFEAIQNNAMKKAECRSFYFNIN